MQRRSLIAPWMLVCSFGSVLAGCPEDSKAPSEEELDAQGPGQPDATAQDGGVSDAAGPSLEGLVPGDCKVTAPTSCPDNAPKFADVQPIFTKQCGQCHGQDWTGEWPLDNYSHISDWQDEIRGELISCSMPPADGGVFISLDDRMKILNWIRCGLPK